jgi:hypothetical protein
VASVFRSFHTIKGVAGFLALPALLLGAPASGQGKTTATAGLARHHRNQGGRRIALVVDGHRHRIIDPGRDFNAQLGDGEARRQK